MKKVVFLIALSLTVSGLAHAASVNGTIKFEGTPPKMAKINMAADPACSHGAGKPMVSETLVLGSGQTMGNVFVQIKTGLPAGKTYPVPTKPHVLDQKGCKYHPHVSAMRAGQPLKIKNSDQTLHNVHAMPKVNRAFNLAMPQTVKEKTKKFRKAEAMFPIKCDVHPWMQTWIGVMDHPFFAVTTKDGKYKIDNLPAGTYDIEVWHEKMKTQTKKITVGASDNKTLDFSYSRGAKTASN